MKLTLASLFALAFARATTAKGIMYSHKFGPMTGKANGTALVQCLDQMQTKFRIDNYDTSLWTDWGYECGGKSWQAGSIENRDKHFRMSKVFARCKDRLYKVARAGADWHQCEVHSSGKNHHRVIGWHPTGTHQCYEQGTHRPCTHPIENCGSTCENFFGSGCARCVRTWTQMAADIEQPMPIEDISEYQSEQEDKSQAGAA